MRTEDLVSKELEGYLSRKIADIKKRSEDLTNKTEECKERL